MRTILKNRQPQNPVELLERDKYKWEADALEAILKALDNSISKDEVRKKIEEIRSRDSEDCLALHGFQREAQIDVLQELLGG